MDNKFQEYEIFCEARRNMNYYKGEVLPFINKICRKDMTSGDIDGFVYDYKKKIYMLLEQKWCREESKGTQDNHLRFLVALLNEAKKGEFFKNWKLGVYKIIGDPPFTNCTIKQFAVKAQDDRIIRISRTELEGFFNLDIDFEELTPLDAPIR